MHSFRGKLLQSVGLASNSFRLDLIRFALELIPLGQIGFIWDWNEFVWALFNSLRLGFDSCRLYLLV